MPNLPVRSRLLAVPPFKSCETLGSRTELINFCRRRGKNQQNKNNNSNAIKSTIRHPVKMPHQITIGSPNSFGEST